ncbi:MAG TPA: hypothetical protein DCF44_10130 [Chitinophagaceae bacterium]|nr:hypothetical protein [Chitinophagaceae bacterium]
MADSDDKKNQFWRLRRSIGEATKKAMCMKKRIRYCPGLLCLLFIMGSGKLLLVMDCELFVKDMPEMAIYMSIS